MKDALRNMLLGFTAAVLITLAIVGSGTLWVWFIRWGAGKC